MMVSANRDVTFDIMKGIGILLMLFCHYKPEYQWPHQFIYSFHMPLFFIVAGYFSKPLKDSVWEGIKKNAKRLLLPFIVTQLLIIAWGGVQTLVEHDLSFVIKHGLSLLWGGADLINSKWGMIYVGPIWFLPALFWGKTLFEIISKKLNSWKLLAVCVSISIASIFLHRFVNSPWCIIQGLSSLTFISIGYLFKQKLFPRWLFWIALACWPVAMLFSNIEMVYCTYKYYVLDVFGACGGIMFVWWISNQIKKINLFYKPLAWIGVLSLVVLCFHNFEWFSELPYYIVAYFPFTIHGFLMILFRFVFTIALVFVVAYTPFIRSVYGVRKSAFNYE